MPQLLGLKTQKVCLATHKNRINVTTMAKQAKRYPAGRNLNHVAFDLKTTPQEMLDFLTPIGGHLFRKGPWWFVDQEGVDKFRLHQHNCSIVAQAIQEAEKGVECKQEESHVDKEDIEEHIVEQKHDTALDRLFDGEESAVVLHSRYPNKTIILVEYMGKKELCRVKDSAFYLPGMKIVVRRDGVQLASKYHPKRPGHL